MADQEKKKRSPEDKPKRESILDLSQYADKVIQVKFAGGRMVSGVLKGFDPLMNLVLEDCVESLRDVKDSSKITDNTRKLGLVVCRGTTVLAIYPSEGTMEIPNPFI